MQIVFENKAPDIGKVRELIKKCGMEGQWEAGRLCDSGDCRYVAAYVRGELIGLGRLAVTNEGASESDSGGRLDMIVLPDYRHRDIVQILLKLLRSGQSSRCAAHAL